MAQIIYERPIYPKNLYLDQVPGHHAEYKKEVLDRQVALIQERGIWKAPLSKHETQSRWRTAGVSRLVLPSTSWRVLSPPAGLRRPFAILRLLKIGTHEAINALFLAAVSAGIFVLVIGLTGPQGAIQGPGRKHRRSRQTERRSAPTFRTRRN